ncbi:aldose epimerase family protein [Methylobacterium durans]|uniref:aldose epimerase family protein n=1 Tax=Methylobacterium durans TaxID=2202825 RepID=UPI002B002932|nr:aldose epimerase family protein [Methylobacterium durans]MEA1835230.1 aldose epimerase family protein [Methylobacterium durans]
MAGEPFGRTRDGRGVTRYALARGRLRAEIIDYGGILTRLDVPDRTGRPANVVLGFSDFADYEARNPHFGALTGRYANRIAGGAFSLDGQEYRLPVNDGPNTLHGGPNGFDKRIWRVEAAEPARLVLHYRSCDGEEGFPGNLDVSVTYALTEDDALRIDYAAWTDRPTVVNLTNHSYFNLAGEGSGEVLGHVVEIAADAFTPTDATQVPTGAIAPVAGTPFDFREPAALGSRIREAVPQLALAKGYDHNFVLRGGRTRLRPVATCLDPVSGRRLEVSTTEPGLQLYTANNLDGTLAGPSRRLYRSGDAVCFETQGFPDAPNRPDFPSAVLRPGTRFTATTQYRFDIG